MQVSYSSLITNQEHLHGEVFCWNQSETLPFAFLLLPPESPHPSLVTITFQFRKWQQATLFSSKWEVGLSVFVGKGWIYGGVKIYSLKAVNTEGSTWGERFWCAAILCCFPTFLVETSPKESEDLAYFPDPATDFLSCPAMGKSFRFTFSNMSFNFSPVAWDTQNLSCTYINP